MRRLDGVHMPGRTLCQAHSGDPDLAESLPDLAGTSVHSNLLVKALLRGGGRVSAVYAESECWPC